ncbi:MAG TPA: hypothetical protein VFI31_02965 [Pirellulales bacterium]|nr:hypothetical protein [Pirellulales bacterium]
MFSAGIVLADEAPLDAEVLETAVLADLPPTAGSVVVEVAVAEIVEAAHPTAAPGVLRRAARLIRSMADWLFGAAALIVGLSFLATYPLLQMLSLGYLLEASGRIARTGRLRDGFVGVRKASRLGSLVFGAWLVLLPLRLVSTLATSARLIDPDSRAARGWSTALWVCTALAVIHIVGACWRGGRLRHFLWPRPIRTLRSLFERGAYSRARDGVWDFVVGLRLPYYFWLGLRGFAGGLVWLFIPITLLAAGQKAPPIGFLGALALMWVLLYLPFLQARFAAENRFRAQFEVAEVRKLFRRAPILFWLSLFCTLLFALPLYLLKIEIVPREAAWLPSLVFVVFIFPARLLTGWSCGLARRRSKNRNFFVRQAARLAMLPVVAFYVFIAFFTQYTSWHGVASLYEQHAFLVPVPFLGL